MILYASVVTTDLFAPFQNILSVINEIYMLNVNTDSLIDYNLEVSSNIEQAGITFFEDYAQMATSKGGLYALLKLNPIAIDGNFSIYNNIAENSFSESFITDRIKLLDAVYFEQLVEPEDPKYIELNDNIDINWGLINQQIGFGGGNGTNLDGCTFGDRLS